MNFAAEKMWTKYNLERNIVYCWRLGLFEFFVSKLNKEWQIAYRKFEKSNYVKVKNSVFHGITQAFAVGGIEIPFPHVSLYTGEITKPFPVDLIHETDQGGS